MLGMDDGISDAERFYACCDHCDHLNGDDVPHSAPCAEGCND